MPRLIAVKPIPHYRLWLRYADGTEGEVDLSDLAGQGVFTAWQTPGFFQRVHLGSHGEVQWSEDIELCADALYLRLTGKKAEEIFPSPAQMPQNA
ncbi:MAG: DUF2442 domain-containing protein [Chloroflexi bacterium]|nr:DUF2442 domain-containing protein [Chloroflexota bacterium]